MSTGPVVGNASPPVAVHDCDLEGFVNPITESMKTASEEHITSESDRQKPLLISPNITAPLCSAGTDDRLDKLELSVQKLTAAMDPKVAHHIENSLEMPSVTTDDRLQRLEAILTELTESIQTKQSSCSELREPDARKRENQPSRTPL